MDSASTSRKKEKKTIDLKTETRTHKGKRDIQIKKLQKGIVPI